MVGAYACRRCPPVGACFLPHLPTLLFSLLSCPYPLPLPQWGRFGFFLCKGSAPCIPLVAEPGRHYSPCQAKHPAGWLVFFLACQPLLLACFLAPIPPPPSPVGKGI